MGREYLMSKGVPEAAIIAETESRNTEESARRIAVIARVNGLRRLVVVSDGTHLFRIHAICAADGLNVLTSPRPRPAVEDRTLGSRAHRARDSELYALAAASALKKRSGVQVRARRGWCERGGIASLSESAQHAIRQREPRCAGGGQKIHRVVVQPAALFERCSQQAVEEQAEDGRLRSSPQTDSNRRAAPSVPAQATMPAATTPASVPARLMAPSLPGSTASKSRDHARTAAEHLSDLRRNRVGRSFSQRRQRQQQEQHRRVRSRWGEASAIHQPGLHRAARDQRRHAQVGGDLGSRAPVRPSAVPSRSFFRRPAAWRRRQAGKQPAPESGPCARARRETQRWKT